MENGLKVVCRVSGGHLETNNCVMYLSERTRILSARPTSDCLCNSIYVKGFTAATIPGANRPLLSGLGAGCWMASLHISQAELNCS